MLTENQIDADTLIEDELSAYAEQEARRLGLFKEQYTEYVNKDFKKSQRGTTTIWVSGLTLAHDELVAASLTGIGYKVLALEAPNTDSLQYGKEFGNRGQCNPTYFTVGHLVKTLVHLRDVEGQDTADIIANNLFLTAGACGPCRFGTYVTEYRKALRDAGFDGFRVLLFQQQGGVKQATGDEVGLEINLKFAVALVQAIVAGDVLNLVGYRIRPYEVEPGSADIAINDSRELLKETLRNGKSVVAALARCRAKLARVAVDRTQPKPVVSIIGEFWAMTTEGDGNYGLQRFLEAEGAEVDIQSVTNWILFMLWEQRFDTEQRMVLRQDDAARKGLEGKDATKKLWGLHAVEKIIRGLFQTYAHTIGLHGYHLPDMTEIAELASKFYDNEVRGGEGHMEVGKVIHFAEDKVNHMTLSVKPFGCMPSGGVSDGVQSVVTARYPEAIFLPIETTGDGAVNVYSRVQMMLFKARQRAREEYESALKETGLDDATVKARVSGSRRWRSPFFRPAHKAAGIATNLVYAVAD